MKTVLKIKMLLLLALPLAVIQIEAASLSACEEIKKEIGGRRKSAITASRLAKLIDRITQKAPQLSEEDLTCVVREAEALDREDISGQLAEQLSGFAEDQPQLFNKVLNSLDGVQKAHVQKMLEDARKVMEGGNG